MTNPDFRPVKGERIVAKIERDARSFRISWTIADFSAKVEEAQSDIYQIGKSRVHFILFWHETGAETYLQVTFYDAAPNSAGMVKVAFSPTKQLTERILLTEQQSRFIIPLNHTYEDIQRYVKGRDMLVIGIDIPIAFGKKLGVLGKIPMIGVRRLSSDFTAKAGGSVSFNLDAKPRVAVTVDAVPSTQCKESTGYVGLMNQGATCYMNSILQSLFHLPAFRRLVFDLPTNGTEDPATCIALNLQRLFCNLQTSNIACATKALATSFGWTSRDVFVQHDVQEFERVLIDNLEKKLEGTVLEESIASLFRGSYRSYIRCMDVEYESSRTEVFYDLSVQVKGCASLGEALARYVEPEHLTGDNQYQADGYGKQDAIMGVEFVELPAVLHVHLRRFEVDMTTGRMVKVGDEFSFPPQIDLGRFVNEQDKPPLYDLMGVLVHSGGIYGGHYYAFLKTTIDDQWFKFNDSTVTLESEKSAMEDNFGGGKGYSAYMLLYVRHEDLGNLYEPVADESVPQHLRDFCEVQRNEEAKRREERIRENKTMTLMFGLEDDIRENTNSGLAMFKPKEPRSIPLDKDTTITNLYPAVAAVISRPVSDIRIWDARENGMPYRLLRHGDTTLRQAEVCRIFVEPKTTMYTRDPFTSDEFDVNWQMESIVYVKFFVQDPSSVIYVGACRVVSQEPIMSIMTPINKKLGLPVEQQLWIYQESLNGIPRRLGTEETFQHMGVRSGAVLIAQLPPGEAIPGDVIFEEAKYMERPAEEEVCGVRPLSYRDVFPSHALQTFDDFLMTSVNLVLVDVYDIDRQTEQPVCVARISPFLTYIRFKQMLAKALDIEYDPEHDSVLLYKCTDGSTLRMCVIQGKIDRTLHSYLQTVPKGLDRRRFYFQVIHGISEVELTTCAQFRVQFSSDGVNLSLEKKVTAVKTATCLELLEKLPVSFDAEHIRFMRVYSSKIVAIIDPTTPFGSPCYTLRVDIIPEPQRNPAMFAFLIPVSFGEPASAGITRAKGTPFLFPVLHNESFVDTKLRLLQACGVEADGTIIRFLRDGKALEAGTIISDTVTLSEVATCASLLFVIKKDDACCSITTTSSVNRNVPVRIEN